MRDVERGQIVIGNDIWIGYGTIILASCKSIGNGAVIGAGSVVTKDVPPYSVVAGVPARVIHMRFDQRVIDALEKSKWWKLNPSQLYQFYNYMDNPLVFAEKITDIVASQVLLEENEHY